MKLNGTAELAAAVEAAHEAGEVIRAGFGHAKKVRDKGGGKSIVTEVDEKVEKLITAQLQSKFEYSLTGEEGGEIEADSDKRWVVDPLDGTTNFTRGTPLLCVSIALMMGNDVLLGVIYNPITEELFYAEMGSGAYLNEEKLSVSSNMVPPIVLMEVGYGNEYRDLFSGVVEKLVGSYSIRKLGTTALECAMVAKGAADIIVTAGDALWDYAAGICLIREAGGTVTDWKGKPWKNQTSYVCASNGIIHDDIVGRIWELQ